MISIFFYFNSESKKIQQSIDSLLNQTSKEFELFIVDGTDKNTDLSIEIDTSSFSKVVFLKTNLENNIAYFSNKFLMQAIGRYVYFMEQDAELDSNFVKKCNCTKNEDFIILSDDVSSHKTILKNKSKDIYNFFLPRIDDKLFSISFLKTNNIFFSSNKFNILIFLYKILTKFNSCGFLSYLVKNKSLSNHIYSDLYFSSEILTNFLHDYKQSFF
jgi:glycosyltransferase involved in cell wall biosynthesis